MATLIGRVGMVIKGAWDSNVAYDTLDVVTYNNNTYIAKQASPAGTLPTNTTYWQLALDASQLQPKEAGKGLSTNDYDNTAKGIVDSTTSNLASKADKVSGATNGNLAGLDANGDLTDSGIKSSNVEKKKSGYVYSADLVGIPLDTPHTVTSDGILFVSPNMGSVFTVWFADFGYGFVVSGGTSNVNTCTLPVFTGMRLSVNSNGGTGSAMIAPYTYSS